MEDADNSNGINWIDESISKKHIRYYEYESFHNIQEIGSGGFAKVYRAKWKNSEQYLALKYFSNRDVNTVKELVREVITKSNKYFLFIYHEKIYTI